MTPVKVLFVCTGNICRSPTAEGVARSVAARMGVADRFEFDSAGTHDYHAGEGPDPRSAAAARRRGYDLASLRARNVTARDFAYYDYVLAMAGEHLEWLQRVCPRPHLQKLGLLLEFSGRLGQADVPDPYYGGAQGFEHVLDLVEEAAVGLIRRLMDREWI
jgi:protein-tyrosine phosphatase